MFKRPGTASAFKPQDGIAQECRTSRDVIRKRKTKEECTAMEESVARRRRGPGQR